MAGNHQRAIGTLIVLQRRTAIFSRKGEKRHNEVGFHKFCKSEFGEHGSVDSGAKLYAAGNSTGPALEPREAPNRATPRAYGPEIGAPRGGKASRPTICGIIDPTKSGFWSIFGPAMGQRDRRESILPKIGQITSRGRDQVKMAIFEFDRCSTKGDASRKFFAKIAKNPYVSREVVVPRLKRSFSTLYPGFSRSPRGAPTTVS